MMTINRRNFLKQASALGLGVSSATTLLAACGEPPPDPNAKVRVNLYHTISAATETYWKQELLPPFEKQHQNMNLVTYQLGVEDTTTIRTKLGAGGDSAPDMLWMSSGETGTYVEANLLPDVDSWLNSHTTIKQNIFPSLVKLSSYQGKVRSLPWMTNNTAMLINLDAFETAGIPVPPQDPTKTWTWDQFADACKLISQKTNMKGFLMHNGGDTWDPWIFHAWLASNGGTFLSDSGDPLFNSPAGVETMTFLQNLVKDGYTAYSDPNKGYDASPWYSGKVAITANGPWNFPDMIKLTNFKFTVVPYPIKTQPATNTGGDQLFIFNHSSRKVAHSFDYAQYMLSDDFQVKFNLQSGNLPVTKSATANAQYQDHLKKYPFLNGWVNSVPYGVARSSLPQSADAQKAFRQKAWDPIILQKANIQQSLADAAAEVSALK